jgi:hypothetical protein
VGRCAADHIGKTFGEGAVYSPETCCFLPVEINSFLVKCNSPNKYSTGTNWHIGQGKWTSKIQEPFTKKRVWLGTFESKESAHEAWRSKKEEYAIQLSKEFDLLDNVRFHLLNKFTNEYWYNFSREDKIQKEEK